MWVAGENRSGSERGRVPCADGRLRFQLHNLLPTLTARERRDAHAGTEHRHKRARALDLLSWSAWRIAPTCPASFPAGSANASPWRALANNPRLIWRTSRPVRSTARAVRDHGAAGELNRTQGTTVLVVTHDRRVAQATQRIVRMHEGALWRIIACSTRWRKTCACWRSKLGQAILNEDDMPLVNMTPEEEAVCARCWRASTGPARSVRAGGYA